MTVDAAREQALARTLDREVAPIWHDRFAHLLLRRLPRLSGGVVLDVHCSTGRTTLEILTRLEDCRVVALEANEAALAMARVRMRPEWKNRVYFKSGDIGAVADMGDGMYDLVVANLVLGETHDRAGVLAELVRTLKPGGQLLATLPLRGSWTEVEEVFHEVLVNERLGETARRLATLGRIRPAAATLAEEAARTGVGADDIVIEHERFELLFPSGREFLFCPAIEHGPLRLWKALLEPGAKAQELFWSLKGALDTYFAERVLSTTITAGLVWIQRPGGGQAPLARRWAKQFPALDAVLRGHAPSSDSDADLDLDIDVADDEEAGAASATAEDDAAIFAALERGMDAAQDAAIEELLEQVEQLEEAAVTAATRAPTPTPAAAIPRPPAASESATRLGLKLGAGRTAPPPPGSGGKPPGSKP